MRRWPVLALALMVPAPAALAHAMPHSTVAVEEPSPGSVKVGLSIPMSELGAAMGRGANPDPETRIEVSRYLRDHVAIVGADGQVWRASLGDVAHVDGDHPAMTAEMSFSAPPGASAIPATLRYDAVNHRIASHYALVYRSKGAELAPLGRLQFPATTLKLR